ncbi:MAG: DUF962 domain-containing protein [Porticoccaceae bacterium]|nr:DUF962 domain-containing protein [Porticoccaceae bacterium]
MKRFNSFKEFYPFYLAEHSNRTSRRLHFTGSWLVLACITFSFWRASPLYLLMTPVVGYSLAWVGHFYYEHNKPATFQYPIYSLLGDWKMFLDILVGKVKI